MVRNVNPGLSKRVQESQPLRGCFGHELNIPGHAFFNRRFGIALMTAHYWVLHWRLPHANYLLAPVALGGCRP